MYTIICHVEPYMVHDEPYMVHGQSGIILHIGLRLCKPCMVRHESIARIHESIDRLGLELIATRIHESIDRSID